MSDIKAFLFDDDRGVSPVIGVILMVAITVILAAVIAAFVLGLGDTNSTAPNVTFDFDYDESNGEVTVTHSGGDSFDPARVELQFDNLEDPSSGNGTLDSVALADGESDDNVVTGNANGMESNPVQAGDSITVDLAGGSDGAGEGPGIADTTGFELSVIFTSEDGGTSSTIGGTTGPDA